MPARPRGESAAMTGDQPGAAELIAHLFDAFRRRDGEAILALVDPRMEFHPVTVPDDVPEPRPYVGHEGMVAYLADVDRVWDKLDIRLDDVRVAGDMVVALGRIHAHGGGRVVDSPAG